MADYTVRLVKRQRSVPSLYKVILIIFLLLMESSRWISGGQSIWCQPCKFGENVWWWLFVIYFNMRKLMRSLFCWQNEKWKDESCHRVIFNVFFFGALFIPQFRSFFFDSLPSYFRPFQKNMPNFLSTDMESLYSHQHVNEARILSQQWHPYLP